MTQPQPVETEDDLTALVLAAITVWLAAVLPAVMATVATYGVPDLSAIWRFQDLWNRQIDRLMPVLARLARRGWESTMADLGRDIPFDPNDPHLTDLLQRVRNLLVRVPDEVYRQLVRSLATGRDRGESQAQLVQRIDSVLNVNGSENWPNRARVIARTELNRFTNAGTLAAAGNVQARGARLVKQWKDRDDSSVRRSHAAVDNEIRELGEPFHVGKSSLQYPIDPSGHPDDVVNCRCRLKILEVRRG